MKYERMKHESREYKYGPGEEFEEEFRAREYVNSLKNHILTELVLAGFKAAVEEMNVVKVGNAFKLTAVIKYPKEIFKLQEEK